MTARWWRYIFGWCSIYFPDSKFRCLVT